jgi:hypothetical protein
VFSHETYRFPHPDPRWIQPTASQNTSRSDLIMSFSLRLWLPSVSFPLTFPTKSQYKIFYSPLGPHASNCPILCVIARVIFVGDYKFTLLTSQKGRDLHHQFSDNFRFHKNECIHPIEKCCMSEHDRFYIPRW